MNSREPREQGAGNKGHPAPYNKRKERAITEFMVYQTPTAIYLTIYQYHAIVPL